MRHGKKFNHLGRKKAHRKAMLANMACSLIEHKRINTTVAKAKALRQFVEPLITKSKPENNVTAEKGTHNRRIVFKNLRNKYAVTELFGTVAEKVADRPGGYTRIIKLGNRLGDNADMAMIELVDFNELYNAGKPKKKTRRGRRGGSKKSEDRAADAVEENKAAETAEEVKAEDKPEAKAEDKPEVKTEGTSEAKTEGASDAKSEDAKDGDKQAESNTGEPKAEAPEAGSTPKVEAKNELETKKSDSGDADPKEVKSEDAAQEISQNEAKSEDKPKAESKSDGKGEETDTKKDDTKE